MRQRRRVRTLMGAEPEEESDTSSTVPSYRPPHCGQKRRRVRSRFGGPCRAACPKPHRAAHPQMVGGHAPGRRARYPVAAGPAWRCTVRLVLNEPRLTIGTVPNVTQIRRTTLSFPIDDNTEPNRCGELQRRRHISDHVPRGRTALHVGGGPDRTTLRCDVDR